MPAAIEISQLTKRFGGRTAVDHVSLSVVAGTGTSDAPGDVMT